MSQIASIQALRAIAALMVAFGHLQREVLLMPAASQHGFTPFALGLTGFGVDLFFVISGFVMVYASGPLFAQPDGGRIFLARRASRIVPLYWGATTLFLLLMAVASSSVQATAPNAIEILKSYLFIPYLHPGDEIMQPVYKLGWTLNYEMFFYVVFAAAIMAPRRAAVGAVLIFFSCLVALGAWLKPTPGPLAFWTDPIILEFAMGALIGALYSEGKRLSPLAGRALILLGVCGVVTAEIFSSDDHGPLRLYWALPAVAIIAGAAFIERPQTNSPATRVMIALGDASYAIYLLHPFVMRGLRMIWDRTGAGAASHPAIYILVGLALIIIMSLIVYRLFEKPMTKRIQALAGVDRGSIAARGAELKPA